MISTGSVYQSPRCTFKTPLAFHDLTWPALFRVLMRGTSIPVGRSKLLRAMTNSELAASWRYLNRLRRTLRDRANKGECVDQTCCHENEGVYWSDTVREPVAMEIRRRIGAGHRPNGARLYRRDIDAWAWSPANAPTERDSRGSDAWVQS
jgi:hypothetical protein